MTKQSRWIRPGFVFCCGIGLCAALLGGCKKARKPSATEIHAITREFVTALKSAAPVEVRSGFTASDLNPASSDFISVTVRADSSSAARAIVFRLLRALNSEATRHRLTREGPVEIRELSSYPRDGPLYVYRRGLVVTHTVDFHEEIVTKWSEMLPPQSGGPRLAIILDDLGSDRGAAQAIFAMPYPLTLSVLPNHAHSADIAQEANRRGFQVMLHLPMKSMGNERAESQELRPGMSADDVSALVDNLLQAVPDVAGVNNHQGSQSTADAALMDELMPVLREHKLFYVDSRTTTATVAYDTAQRFGVRSGFRNVPFLDDVAEVGAVRKQLQLALRDARKKGDAIAIGHPHPATLQALRDVLPDAKAQGVRLVFASEIVH